MTRPFTSSFIVTVAAVVSAALLLGFKAALTTLILIFIEVAFSFDNAVINAKTLERMPKIWRRMFLTLGMLVAIVGMRLVFPILIVSMTAKLGWLKVVDLALHQPEHYAHYLQAAHVSISAFGGGFLLVLVLFFLLDHDREILWLEAIERPLQQLRGRLWAAPLVSALVICAVALISADTMTIFRAGILGIALFTGIRLVVTGLNNVSGAGKTGQFVSWSAALAFVYLEVLDASFSFDGVLGAFAITNIVPIIAIGLGVGALWVRSLTLYMVDQGALAEYRYLEHGAHYAIFVLAAALLVSLFVAIPDAVPGIAGLGVIGASIVASREANNHHG